jgi:hypothetical protein
MLDVLMEAEHFCSIVAVSIPFLLFEFLIIGKIRIFDISKIHICYARSLGTKGKDSTRCFSGIYTVTTRLSFVSVGSLNGKFYEFSRDDYWCLQRL